jgi:hypothetical protein
MVSVLDVVAGFAKDNEATRKERLAERKELLAEKKDLLKQVALNKYAADEAIYQKNLGTWLNTEKELDMLKSSGTALNPKDLATKIATIEGRIPSNREIEDEEMSQILSPYLANIKEYEDENGNKKFDYTGNLKPVAPSFDKYYNPDKYISAVDDMSKAVQGDWVRFVKGDESIAKEDKILATLQNDLEEGSSRANLDIRNYFGTPEKYTFDRKDIKSEESSIIPSDDFQSLVGLIPEDNSDAKKFRDDGITASNGQFWTFNRDDLNTFLAKEKSEGQMDAITFSVLKTIPKGEEKYIASYEQGKLTLKGDAELTRGQIELAYKQIKEQKVLKALQNNDNRYLNMEGVTRDLQKWFAENSVELRNQKNFGRGGQVASMYIIPNTVDGHSDPVKTAEIKQDLQSLIQQEDMNGVVAMFEEKGIPLPNAQPVTQDSSFGQWSEYLDAYSEGMITKQAKISNTENPFASVTSERAIELEMPILAGMVIDRNVQSKDQITAKNVGLFVKDPENPNSPTVFISWEKIHNDIVNSPEESSFYFEGINEPNKPFEGDYEAIKQMFNLTSSAIDVADAAAGAAPDVENQMSDMMKITFDNVENFLPPKKIRIKNKETAAPFDYLPSEELQSWASETLPAWNNFIASLPKEKPAYMAKPDEEYKQKMKEFRQAEKYLKLNNKIQEYIS